MSDIRQAAADLGLAMGGQEKVMPDAIGGLISAFAQRRDDGVVILSRAENNGVDRFLGYVCWPEQVVEPWMLDVRIHPELGPTEYLLRMGTGGTVWTKDAIERDLAKGRLGDTNIWVDKSAGPIHAEDAQWFKALTQLRRIGAYFRRSASTDDGFGPEADAADRVLSIVQDAPRPTARDLKAVLNELARVDAVPHYNGSGWLDFRLTLNGWRALAKT